MRTKPTMMSAGPLLFLWLLATGAPPASADPLTIKITFSGRIDPAVPQTLMEVDLIVDNGILFIPYPLETDRRGQRNRALAFANTEMHQQKCMFDPNSSRKLKICATLLKTSTDLVFDYYLWITPDTGEHFAQHAKFSVDLSPTACLSHLESLKTTMQPKSGGPPQEIQPIAIFRDGACTYVTPNTRCAFTNDMFVCR